MIRQIRDPAKTGDMSTPHGITSKPASCQWAGGCAINDHSTRWNALSERVAKIIAARLRKMSAIGAVGVATRSEIAFHLSRSSVHRSLSVGRSALGVRRLLLLPREATSFPYRFAR